MREGTLHGEVGKVDLESYGQGGGESWFGVEGARDLIGELDGLGSGLRFGLKMSYDRTGIEICMLATQRLNVDRRELCGRQAEPLSK